MWTKAPLVPAGARSGLSGHSGGEMGQARGGSKPQVIFGWWLVPTRVSCVCPKQAGPGYCGKVALGEGLGTCCSEGD